MEYNEPIKLIDKNYRPGQSKNYHLNVKLTGNSFSYQVFDPRRQKFLALFDARRDDAALDFVPYAKEDELLQQTFRKIRVMFSSPYHVLIPESLFSKSDEELYARMAFTGGLSGNGDWLSEARGKPLPAGDEPFPDILLNQVPGLNAYLLSGIDPQRAAAIDTYFAGARIFHEGCPFITGLLDRLGEKAGPAPGTCLCLKIELNYLEIAFISQGKLHFYNRFTYGDLPPEAGQTGDAHGYEQLAYFPLFVCEQLGIHPHKIKVLVYGLLDRSSEKYKLVRKYFKHVDFGKLSGRFKYSKQLYDVPQHYFFSLLNLELCE